MKIFFDIIGCRLNQSEVERLANIFRALGHKIVGDPGEADLAIINTCAVTVKAAADSRKKLRRAGRYGAFEVIATGCWATLYPEKALAIKGVTGVVDNTEKDNLVSKVLNLSPDTISNLHIVRTPLPGDRGRTRAFIKVQEGCDNYCTYCLTRIARGKSRSRFFQEIAKDIHAAIDGGAKEIVLTGVQLGAWGRDFSEPKGLAYLLHRVLSIAGFERLRLSSIEPWDFSLELLPFWQDNRMCKHLHIPLQSGSDKVLKSMGRPINVDNYRGLIHVIHDTIPKIAITTDVIAGFPGESQEDFTETTRIIRLIGFAGGHVFSYSPRPGTAAFEMESRVSVQITKERNAILRKIFLETGQHYREKFIGTTMDVLWESSNQDEFGGWHLSGLTDNYIRVYSEAETNLWNQITPVRLQAHHPRRQAVIGWLSNRSEEEGVESDYF